MYASTHIICNNLVQSKFSPVWYKCCLLHYKNLLFLLCLYYYISTRIVVEKEKNCIFCLDYDDVPGNKFMY